jgi:hypothetical protein
VTTEDQSTLYHGVMISSTFRDLERHRLVLMKALNDHELMHVAMENAPAIADTGIIGSSLAMVRKASAYILLIGARYGQIPSSSVGNPDNLSITELEFLEAQILRRPTLLFVMGESHPLTKSDIDLEPESRAKLDTFRARAMRWNDEADAARVYCTFNSLEDFERKVTPALARLKQYLSTHPTSTVTSSTSLQGHGGIRHPPLYANPPYLGSHEFLGRADQVRVMDEWALASDSHTVLFFEAIGGTGKSILAWNWLTTRSTTVRKDWAGRFWYSFYERGAQTRDFLLRALAYMHGLPQGGIR